MYKQATLDYLTTGSIGGLAGLMIHHNHKDRVDKAILGGLLAMGALAYYKHLNRDRTQDGRPSFDEKLTQRGYYLPRDA